MESKDLDDTLLMGNLNLHTLCMFEGFFLLDAAHNDIQSTLVISNSKGLSEILRDIRSSTYQVCRIEERII